MERLREATTWLCDMDGVLLGPTGLIPGADAFVERVRERGYGLQVVTNNSLFTPDEIVERMAGAGLTMRPEEIWTSAMAAASYVAAGTGPTRVFAIGRPAIHLALADVGCVRDPSTPEVVVLAETRDYDFDEFARAVQLIDRGAAFVATNPEATSPTLDGPVPGCGAMAALIERATGVAPYIVGKPNPAMIHSGLARLGVDAGRAVLVGDRIETDVVAGAEAGLTTVLVLSGVTTLEELGHAVVVPDVVVGSLAELISLL